MRGRSENVFGLDGWTGPIPAVVSRARKRTADEVSRNQGRMGYCFFPPPSDQDRLFATTSPHIQSIKTVQTRFILVICSKILYEHSYCTVQLVVE